MSIRCYSELIQLPTFMDRYQYLRLDGVVGEETFGFDRYMNQAFYKSPEWRQVRDAVIARDLGCDLGVAGREIFRRPIIHHMNPHQPKGHPGSGGDDPRPGVPDHHHPRNSSGHSLRR